MNAFRQFLLRQEGILFVILLATIAYLSFASDEFLTSDNLLNLIRQMTEIGLIALPMTYVMITGGIDLSVGSIFGVAAILIGYSWHDLGLPLWSTIFVALAAGLACGALNGLVITRLGVPPLITTIATLLMFRGFAEGISEARSVRGYPDWFQVIGQGQWFGLPAQLWILAVAIVIAWVILARTIYGRSLYAIGFNQTAARFSAIPVRRYILIAYAFSGLMAGLGAYIYVSRVTTTRSDMGMGIELDAISAVVLGGTSIFGGIGGIGGTLLGLIMIQLLENGLQLTGHKSETAKMVIGSVLILSVVLSNYVERRRGWRT